jgi:hypothetical protein
MKGRGIAYGFPLKKAVIPDKLGNAERRSGTAASAAFTRRSRIFALRAESADRRTAHAARRPG